MLSTTCPLAFGDLIQTEKEITACKAEQIHKITPIFSQKNNPWPFFTKLCICSVCIVLRRQFLIENYQKLYMLVQKCLVISRPQACDKFIHGH